MWQVIYGTSALRCLGADFREITEKSSKGAKKGTKMKKLRHWNLDKRQTQTGAGVLRAGVWTPSIHISVGWVWWPAYNPSTWEQRQDLAGWLGRLAESSSSRMGKKPCSIDTAVSLVKHIRYQTSGLGWSATPEHGACPRVWLIYPETLCFPSPSSYQLWLGLGGVAQLRCKTPCFFLSHTHTLKNYKKINLLKGIKIPALAL